MTCENKWYSWWYGHMIRNIHMKQSQNNVYSKYLRLGYTVLKRYTTSKVKVSIVEAF